MSGIANLYNVPSTPEELSHWASTHMAMHRDINRRIYELSNGLVVLPEYVLDPINPNDTGVWDDQHQIMHQDMDAVLGISGFDLTGVDFKNRDTLVNWVQLHASEHYQASNILGIG